MTPTEQRPRDCKHYLYNIGGWTHWCVMRNLPCVGFNVCPAFDTCPDYQPKEKKDERADNS